MAKAFELKFQPIETTERNNPFMVESTVDDLIADIEENGLNTVFDQEYVNKRGDISTPFQQFLYNSWYCLSSRWTNDSINEITIIQSRR